MAKENDVSPNTRVLSSDKLVIHPVDNKFKDSLGVRSWAKRPRFYIFCSCDGMEAFFNFSMPIVSKI